MNTKQLDAVAEIVGQLVADALAPIRRDLEALSKRLDGMPDVQATVDAAVAALPVPSNGADGKSVTVDDVRPLIEAEVAKSIPAAPTLDDVRPIIDAEVAKAAAALPVPSNGADGKSVTVDDVRPLIEAEVAKAAAALPVPKDGVGLAGAMIDRDGNLQITLTDGSTKDLGPVVGKSLEDFGLEYLPETHEVRITARCAGRVQELRYDAGGIRLGSSDRGYWRDGTKAKACEGYSYDGCFWVARTATTAKPAPDSEDWALVVRQGRPGAPGKDYTAPRAPQPIKVG